VQPQLLEGRVDARGAGSRKQPVIFRSCCTICISYMCIITMMR
jgi:hypothetical protein